MNVGAKMNYRAARKTLARSSGSARPRCLVGIPRNCIVNLFTRNISHSRSECAHVLHNNIRSSSWLASAGRCTMRSPSETAASAANGHRSADRLTVNMRRHFERFCGPRTSKFAQRARTHTDAARARESSHQYLWGFVQVPTPRLSRPLGPSVWTRKCNCAFSA